MDSSLRPRDIQARIRAGESPEAVADAAQTTVEKIMPFAGPVMNERAHVAARAQASSVRRRSGDAGARTLGEAVAAALQAHHLAPESVEWDSWRRNDGRWTLVGAFSAPGRSGSGTFTYDVAGNYVTLDDDDARWLVGDAVPGAAAPRDDLRAARDKHLRALEDDELPLGDDAIELVSDEGPPRAVPDPEAPAPEASGPEAPASEESAPGEWAPAQPASDSSDEPDEAEEKDTQPAGEPPARPAKRKGRASVPSWDEIMFGGGKQE